TGYDAANNQRFDAEVVKNLIYRCRVEYTRRRLRQYDVARPGLQLRQYFCLLRVNGNSYVTQAIQKTDVVTRFCQCGDSGENNSYRRCARHSAQLTDSGHNLPNLLPVVFKDVRFPHCTRIPPHAEVWMSVVVLHVND